MKGIRRQGKNSWQIQVYTGTGADGKPQRCFVTVHGSKGDAEKKRNEMLVGLAKGVPVPVGRLTVAEHLRNWLEGYVKTNCSQGTLDTYQYTVKNHLIPAFGHIQLKDLQPQAIQAYYGKACDRVSARTVYQHHRVLSESLKYGLRQGYLGRNVCELVDPPSPRKKTMRNLKPEEVGILLETAEDNPHYPIFYTAVSTGLRRNELIGLRWRDIDLEMLSISVSQVLYKRRGVCVQRAEDCSQSAARGHDAKVGIVPEIIQGRT